MHINRVGDKWSMAVHSFSVVLPVSSLNSTFKSFCWLFCQSSRPSVYWSVSRLAHLSDWSVSPSLSQPIVTQSDYSLVYDCPQVCCPLVYQLTSLMVFSQSVVQQFILSVHWPGCRFVCPPLVSHFVSQSIGQIAELSVSVSVGQSVSPFPVKPLSQSSS